MSLSEGAQRDTQIYCVGGNLRSILLYVCEYILRVRDILRNVRIYAVNMLRYAALRCILYAALRCILYAAIRCEYVRRRQTQRSIS